MRIPGKIPIRRMEDYHTHYLGRTAGGTLFWGYQTFAWLKPISEIRGEDIWQYRRNYTVLHTFTRRGKYLATRSISTNPNEKKGDPDRKIEEWLSELGNFEYCDIKIRLFQTTIDDIVFGLIPGEEYNSIDLQPSTTISFQKPWDGEYYT